ncbi:hypothetical protein MKW94_005805 [Papaver nudicaule]|uniref:TF-B3 domain-containing protein n=1 Tax=Papaver nudicaule TaxID=74823 RepID=A0AA41SK39_PAPNU|nr:hypothetical protein [Papaver nudicaule]
MDRQGARINMGRDKEDVEKFQVVHFFTILSENFRSQLVFPERFVKNCLREELSDISIVSLRGPSGQTWTVKLMRHGSDDDDILYLGKGWEIFVKDHNLKENDLLFLKYKLGGSVFDVLMFDDENFCEKESSYFVRNCKNEGCHTSNGLNGRKRRVEREPSMEIVEPKRLHYKVKRISISDDEVEDSCSETSRLPGRKGKALASDKRREDSEAEDSQVNPRALVLRKGPPNEKDDAFQQAIREGKRRGRPHFAVLMKTTHVARICSMTVPVNFSRNHIPLGTASVSLKLNGKKWSAGYGSYGPNKSSGFRGWGWRDFVRSNKLKVGDVCLFETTSKTSKKSVILNASIFRI